MGNIPALQHFLFAHDFADELIDNDDDSAFLVRSVTVVGRGI